MDRAAPTSVSGRVWHPWLRVSRLIITLRTTRWDTATWPTAKATLLNAVKERSKVQSGLVQLRMHGCNHLTGSAVE